MNTVSQLTEVPGLITVRLDHEVSTTKGSFDWKGPKISREVWNQVLAFFRWTYETMHSESQVRMFVHPEHGWAAWAFPQKARTGMSATELPDNPSTMEQRAQFPTPEWKYYITVHHHNSCSAFQSSVDQANERTQDGWHITVGGMDKSQYDLHARFYFGGHEFEPDMSWIWDVTEAMSTVPEWVSKMLPTNSADKMARSMMCQPPPLDQEFPAQWKENVIEVKPEFSPGAVGHSAWDGGWTPYYSTRYVRKPGNYLNDLDKAAKEWSEYMTANPDDEVEKGDLLEVFLGWPALVEMTEILYRHEVSLERLAEHIKYKSKIQSDPYLMLPE